MGRILLSPQALGLLFQLDRPQTLEAGKMVGDAPGSGVERWLRITSDID